MNIRPKTLRRLTFLLFILILMSGLVVLGLQRRARNNAAMLAQKRAAGMELYEQGAYAEALPVLGYYLNKKEVEHKKRGDADAATLEVLLVYGKCRNAVALQANAHLTEAKKIFQRYLELRGDAPADDAQALEAQHALLRLYEQTGYHKEVVQLADEVLARRPDDPEAHWAKVRALSQGPSPRWPEALKAAEQMNKALPTDLRGQLQAQRIRAQVGAPAEEIIATAEALRQQHEGDPRFELLLGRSYLLLAESDKYNGVAGGSTRPASPPGEAGPRDEWLRQAQHWVSAAAGRTPPDGQFVAVLVETLDRGGLFPESLRRLHRAADALKDDANVRRELVERLWQNRLYQAAVERTAGADPAHPATDIGLLGFRTMSLYQLGEEKRPEADAIVQALAGRKASPAAEAWVLALRARFASRPAADAAGEDGAHRGAPAADARQQLNAYQGAIARDRDNPVFHFLAGEALSMLGESEAATHMWGRAAQLAPEWALPHAVIARLRLEEGRKHEALQHAADAARRSPHMRTVQVTHGLAAFAVLSDDRARTRADDLEKLLRYVGKIQESWPNEPETLPLHVTLLARTGRKDAATEKVRQVLEPSTAAAHAATLLQLEAVSRAEGLGLEDALLERAGKAPGGRRAVAARQAMDLYAAGKTAEGFDLLKQQQKAAGGENDPRWNVAVAEYQELAGDGAAAAKTWAALGDAHPNDLAVQTAVLRAEARWLDRALWKRTIERVRALTGDGGQLWRLERCRWLLSGGGQGDAGANDRVEAVTMLTELSREAPRLPEVRRMLGLALAQDNALPRAIEELTEAAKLRPDDVETALELAAVHRAAGHAREAGEALDRVWQRAADLPPSLRLRLAAAFEEDGRPERGIGLITGAAPGGSGAATRPSNANARLPSGPARDALLARLYRRVGRSQEAEALYLKLADDPAASPAELGPVAEYFAAAGKADLANTIVDRLAASDGRPGARELMLGRLADRYGPEGDAVKHLLAAAAAAPQSPDAWRSLAAHHLRRGRAGEAAAAADKGLAAAPGDAVLKLYGQHAATLKAYPRPAEIQPLIDVVAYDPDNAPAAETMALLARAQEAKEPRAETIAKLRALADKHTSFMPLQERLVSYYLAQGQLDQAEAVATKATRISPYDPEPAKLATRVYAAQRQWRKMLDSANQWRQRTPEHPLPADLAVAEAYLGLDQPHLAVRQLEGHVAARPLAPTPAASGAAEPAPIPPQTMTLHRTYARALIAADRVQDAAAHLRPTLAESADARALWLGLARFHKDAAAAAAWIEQVAPLVQAGSEDDAEVLLLADAWFAVGRTHSSPAALEKAREALKPITVNRPATTKPAAAPAETQAWALLAYASQELADYDTAADVWRRLLRSGRSDPAFENNLAYVLLLRGRAEDLPEARQLAEKAVADAPGAVAFHDTLARILAQSGQHDLAVAAFRKALSLDPKSLDAMIGLAGELVRSGAKESRAEARRLLEQIARDVEKSDAAPLPAPIRRQFDAARAALDPVGDGR